MIRLKIDQFPFSTFLPILLLSFCLPFSKGGRDWGTHFDCMIEQMILILEYTNKSQSGSKRERKLLLIPSEKEEGKRVTGEKSEFGSVLNPVADGD